MCRELQAPASGAVWSMPRPLGWVSVLSGGSAMRCGNCGVCAVNRKPRSPEASWQSSASRMPWGRSARRAVLPTERTADEMEQGRPVSARAGLREGEGSMKQDADSSVELAKMWASGGGATVFVILFVIFAVILVVWLMRSRNR